MCKAFEGAAHGVGKAQRRAFGVLPCLLVPAWQFTKIMFVFLHEDALIVRQEIRITVLLI